MPELPEVESLTTQVRSNALGLKFSKIDFYRADIREKIDQKSLIEVTAQQKITKVIRRGKYMLMATSKGAVGIHLGMSGKFVIESKKGYNKIDLVNCFSGKCSELDEFLKQVSSDAERTKRKPLLIWKKDRKEDIAFLRESDLPNKPKLYLLYNGWIATTFDFILSHPDNFFF